MSPDTPTRAPGPTLDELWRRYAEQASDARLAALTALGAIAATACGALALGIVPARLARWWPLLLPGIGAGGFGLWGIAAREEAERRAAGSGPRALLVALAVLRWIAALAAALALGVGLALGLSLALGIVKS